MATFMADEIQFGEVEQVEPECALRPDEDRQFVVAPYGNPAETDLAIFIDLDVHVELDRHANSDTSVELGGVLLGRACVDERGRAFVMVSECIRAEHYESTAGSFKFTHETWAAITRERERFAADLQIVGWYHTHPGWGIFLSGMDLFICEHFFNKPLDVAYVVDPCRQERGMFQWADSVDVNESDEEILSDVSQSPHRPETPGTPRRAFPTERGGDRCMALAQGYFLFTARAREAALHSYLATA